MPVVNYATPQTPARRSGAASWIAPAVCVGLAFAVHFTAPAVSFGYADYVNRVLLDVGVAVILAVSLNIVNGYTGQFSIGHAAFFALGGYVAGFVSYYLGLILWKDNFWVADAARSGIFGPQSWIMLFGCLLGGILAAAAGWVVGLPSLRLKGDYLAIVTLGFGEIVRVLLQQTNGQLFTWADLSKAEWKQLFPPPVGGAAGFTDIPKVTNLFWMYLAVGLTILFAVRLKLSSSGRAMLSIREDEIAAEAMGVNVTKLKVRAFVYAAFFAGIAGGLYAHQMGNVLRPIDAGFVRSFDVIIFVVLGGLGSISGAALAAALLTILLTVLQEFSNTEVLGVKLLLLRMPAYALMLILVMIFRPKGLFGVNEIWDYVLRHRRGRRALEVKEAEAAA